MAIIVTVTGPWEALRVTCTSGWLTPKVRLDRDRAMGGFSWCGGQFRHNAVRVSRLVCDQPRLEFV